MDTKEDPQANKWEVFEQMLADKTVSVLRSHMVKGGWSLFLEEVRGFIPASQLLSSQCVLRTLTITSVRVLVSQLLQRSRLRKSCSKPFVLKRKRQEGKTG